MLKNRLLFGTLMAMAFGVIVVLDGWLDGSLTGSDHDDKAVQATLLCVLVAVLMVGAHAELAGLAAAKNLKIFRPVTTAAAIACATTWYWPQFTDVSPKVYVYLISAFALMGLFLCQYFRCRTDTVLGNCGASCFSIIYLGVLSGFVVALRIDFGLWPMLMFICVIKSADIGAYACGSLFGKHKFSPQLSPGKTWQGMAGAAVTAVMIAILFALSCDIMVWWLAAVFGFCFAVVGQMGDLAESMIKRDAEQKDSANKVPGFGGILDIIDSVLVAAPFAYLFFMFNDRLILLQS